MPTVKINGKEVTVPPGTNMIEAAKLVGEEIPHYCYHPNLSIAGNCRMCLVDIEAGGRGPDIACNMQARDGLAIRTDTDNVKKMRRSVMEFLLVNHPLDCPICDQSGECRLQDYYMEHGQYDSRGVEQKVSKHKRQDIGDMLVLDAERCVECSRCVRFGDEVTHTGDLRLMNRGDHTEIGLFPGERIEHQYQGCLADVCPVGALTNKDFRFERRVWYLRETRSVCGGCATGCNIRVCHQEGEVFRFLPERNDAVNKSWMCDPGRLGHKEIAGPGRVLRARVDGAATAVDDAVAALAGRIKAAGAGKVGFVLGTRATNEGNWALAQVARKLGARCFVVDGNDPAAFDYTDDILVSGDKNPNATGARLVASEAGGKAELLLALSDLSLLVVLEDDLSGRLPVVSLPALAALAWRRSATVDSAAVVLPTTHPVEMDGTWVNGQGRLQRVRRAVNPAGDALPDYALVEKLGAALGAAPGTSLGSAAFAAMARAVPALAGIELKKLPAEGVVVAAPAAAATAPAGDGAEVRT